MIGERHIIRNQFLTFLEYYYIQKKKIEEANQNSEIIEAKKERRKKFDEIRERKKNNMKYLIQDKDKMTIEKLNEVDIDQLDDTNHSENNTTKDVEPKESTKQHSSNLDNVIIEPKKEKVSVLTEKEIKTVKKLKKEYKDKSDMMKRLCPKQ